jgi:methionyl-tRNA synthetase
MLMSAGLALPRQVFGHGWVNFMGQRMSKSLGTSLDPADVAQRFGPDPLRLYLVKEISYGGDGDFTWERYEERYNVDLANNFGNLVSRLAAMAEKYRGLRLEPAGDGGRLAEVADRVVTRFGKAMDGHALHEGAAAAFQLVDATNEFIAETSPWTLARDPANAARLDDVLFQVAEAIRLAAVLLLPVMPSSCAEILRRVGEQGPVADLRLARDGRWRNDGVRQIQKGAALWPRAEESRVDVGADLQVGPKEKPAARQVGPKEKPVDAKPTEGAPTAPATDAAAPGTPVDNRISIDDFMKVELRTARVLEAEAVPKSKKLLKLRVDVGTEQRTVLAGIAEAYQPEQLVGKTIAIVFNLKPAKLMGIESNGMVLAASPEGGNPTLITFDDAVQAGWRIR